MDEVATYYQEVQSYIDEIDLTDESGHLWERYQQVTAFLLRLTEIHNTIALKEINGAASPGLKKLRTMILDPTIERFEQIARYESRKISAKALELEMDR